MLLINSVSVNNKADYIHGLYQKIGLYSRKNIDTFLEHIETDFHKPTLARIDEIPELTPENERKIRELKALFLRNRANNALSENEKIEKEGFSYLTQSHKIYPINTIAFFRKTNFAEYHFIFERYRFDGEKLIEVEPPRIYPNSHKSSMTETLAEKFIVALAEAIGGEVAEGMLKELFGDNEACSPEQMKKMFDELKEYIQDVEIRKIGAYLKTKMEYLRDDYPGQKKAAQSGGSVYDPQEIHHILNDIKGNIATWSNLVESDSRYYSEKDTEHFTRRRLFKLNINLILFRILVLNEMAFWEQFLNFNQPEKYRSRVDRNYLLNYLIKNLSKMKTDNSKILSTRLKLISEVKWAESGSIAIYDDRYLLGKTPEKGDSLKCTLTGDGQTDQEGDGMTPDHDKCMRILRGRRTKYLNGMDTNFEKEVRKYVTKASNSIKLNQLFYMDDVCYHSGTDTYWFFSGNLCFTRKHGGSINNPKPISDVFADLPEFENTNPIDGVVYIQQEKNYYFFVGDSYHQVSDITKKKTETGKIKNKWGLDGKNFDYVIYRGTDAVPKLWFFKGDDYWEYNFQTKENSKGGLSGWGKLEKFSNAGFYSQVDGGYYFFKGIFQQYTKAGDTSSMTEPKLIREGGW